MKYSIRIQKHCLLSGAARCVLAGVMATFTLPAITANAQTSGYSQQLDDWQTKVRIFERQLKQECDQLDEEQLVIDALKEKKDKFDQLSEQAYLNNKKITREVDQVYAASGRIRDNLDTALDAGSINQQSYDSQTTGLARATNKIVSRLLDKKQLEDIYEGNFYAYARKYHRAKRTLKIKKAFKKDTKADFTDLRNNPPLNPILIEGKPNPNPDAPKFPDQRLEDFQFDLDYLQDMRDPSSPNYINRDELREHTVQLADFNRELTDFIALKELCLSEFPAWENFENPPPNCLKFYAGNATIRTPQDDRGPRPNADHNDGQTKTEAGAAQEAREDVLGQVEDQLNAVRKDENAINAEAAELLEKLQRALDEAVATLPPQDTIKPVKTPNDTHKGETKSDRDTATSTATRADDSTKPKPRPNSPDQ